MFQRVGDPPPARAVSSGLDRAHQILLRQTVRSGLPTRNRLPFQKSAGCRFRLRTPIQTIRRGKQESENQEVRPARRAVSSASSREENPLSTVHQKMKS